MGKKQQLRVISTKTNVQIIFPEYISSQNRIYWKLFQNECALKSQNIITYYIGIIHKQKKSHRRLQYMQERFKSQNFFIKDW